MFDNLYKPIYISTKKSVEIDNYNNEIVTYNEPFFYKNANYQPLNGNDLMAYMSAYGETKNKLVRLFIDACDIGLFKEYDLAYLYGATPNGEEVNGKFANYIVRTYAEQNTKIMVVFEEIIKEKQFMKVKVKNKKNDKIVKEIDSNLLGDYLATDEWIKVEEKTEKPQENTRGKNTSFNSEE